MKGEVVEMKVGVGDKVIKGQNLAVLSAMKMEMVLQSPVNGVVRAIEVKRGQKVEVNFQTLKLLLFKRYYWVSFVFRAKI